LCRYSRNSKKVQGCGGQGNLRLESGIRRISVSKQGAVVSEGSVLAAVGYLFYPLHPTLFVGMFRAMINPFLAKPLTGTRIGLAIAVAVIADGMQFAAGPLGWVGFDQVVDMVAMILTSLLLGFHPLLLPTFVIEFIPVLGALPTWSGCVGAVILLRKRSRPPVSNPAPPKLETEIKKSDEPGKPVIDV
jgi:hypothetical protein